MKRFLSAGEGYVLFKRPSLEVIPCSSDTTLTDNKRYRNKTTSKAYGLLVRPWFRQAAGILPVALVCLSARTDRAISRLLTGISSSFSRSVVEGLSKPTRRIVEAESKDCRTTVEQISNKQANKPLRNQLSIYSTLEGFFSLRLHKVSFSRTACLKPCSKRLWAHALYACLLLLLLDVQIGTAQESDPTPRDRAVLLADSPHYFRIGDKLPKDFVIGYDPFDSLKTIKLSDFKGKAVILDAWATWCGSCISKFPMMDSLQRQYPERLQIMLVNVQGIDTPERVRKFLSDYKEKNPDFELDVVIESIPLNTFFEFQYIPHYIWIDKNRRIRAFTDAKDITDTNLQRFFAGQSIYIPMKLN